MPAPYLPYLVIWTMAPLDEAVIAAAITRNAAEAIIEALEPRFPGTLTIKGPPDYLFRMVTDKGSEARYRAPSAKEAEELYYDLHIGTTERIILTENLDKA